VRWTAVRRNRKTRKGKIDVARHVEKSKTRKKNSPDMEELRAGVAAASVLSPRSALVGRRTGGGGVAAMGSSLSALLGDSLRAQTDSPDSAAAVVAGHRRSAQRAAREARRQRDAESGVRGAWEAEMQRRRANAEALAERARRARLRAGPDNDPRQSLGADEEQQQQEEEVGVEEGGLEEDQAAAAASASAGGAEDQETGLERDPENSLHSSRRTSRDEPPAPPSPAPRPSPTPLPSRTISLSSGVWPWSVQSPPRPARSSPRQSPRPALPLPHLPPGAFAKALADDRRAREAELEAQHERDRLVRLARAVGDTYLRMDVRGAVVDPEASGRAREVLARVREEERARARGELEKVARWKAARRQATARTRAFARGFSFHPQGEHHDDHDGSGAGCGHDEELGLDEELFAIPMPLPPEIAGEPFEAIFTELAAIEGQTMVLDELLRELKS
jgi:hypothetical protein